MKSPLALLALLVGCTTAPPSYAPAPAASTIVAQLNQSTVALVDGTHPYCSGVWIGDNQILTAAHCVTEGDEVTQKVDYVIGEGGDVYHAELARFDTKIDLALIRAFTPPLHPFAPVASSAPLQGEELHIFGHPRGFWWTYLHGYVAAPLRVDDETVDELGISGPFLQVEAPIAPGNSGGGAFNTDGQLVGICSWGQGDLPAQGFYVALPTIRKFLRYAG